MPPPPLELNPQQLVCHSAGSSQLAQTWQSCYGCLVEEPQWAGWVAQRELGQRPRERVGRPLDLGISWGCARRCKGLWELEEEVQRIWTRAQIPQGQTLPATGAALALGGQVRAALSESCHGGERRGGQALGYPSGMPEQAGAFTLPPGQTSPTLVHGVLPRSHWVPTAAPTALTWLVCPSPGSFTPSPSLGVLLSLQDPPLVPPFLKPALGWG